ncbi:tartrate dehydrogenase [Lysinibacillus sp. 2017]|uniref:tartrate dehydrogenase n=1 Tax=unclassified Lysinibacillus TaxID=2636778 RepID=UPI000D5287A0|nr:MULTISPECIES: tartrate dehydrogenase [unclassified Lysinibacillus]AWE09269.1 tartrate dehydrogenase [Lysinibacillus sp. 2017]TGN36595.1 tartrate dehydrogenase [Lysinibacillus sp. S2017]
MKTYKIAVIPGDGIGKEVVPAAIQVLEQVAKNDGSFQFEWTYFPWGCDYYLENGEMMPKDGIETLKKFDQIFLGAVGMPEQVPDHISLWGLLIKIRREMKQAINVRPAKLLKGLDSPLKNPNNFNITVVRENSEGEYSESGGRIHQGQDEIAIQNAIFTRKATERAMRYAFELAKNSRGHVTSATKSNGLTYSMPFWDEVFAEVKQDYLDIDTAVNHIDALAAFFVMKPHVFDVIVASNLFGDILTDLGGAIMGSIGIAPAANLNIEREYPSMFEPVHGSAPDIAGKGIANPIGQIWTGKMMLDFLGHHEAGQKMMDAIEATLEKGIKTGDIGGSSTMEEVVTEILKQLN